MFFRFSAVTSAPVFTATPWLAERQFSKKSNTSRRLRVAEAKDEAMALS